MDYYIVIPAHNEERFLKSTLNSILEQTLLPQKVIVVNDNSTDGTEAIIDGFLTKSPLLQKVNINSSTEHMPGSKVINAFNAGVKLLDDDYDILVKLDADLILPPNYFEVIAKHFERDTNLGICGGFIYEEHKMGAWELNHPMDKNHVRGAFKAYSKPCFKAIGGLKNAMGWDTVDELLALYHGFKTYTDASLKVKHLKPTGKAYDAKAKKLQGKAMYTMRYGFIITMVASIKMALKNKKFTSFLNNMAGYFEALKKNTPYLVTKEEGVFIRAYRWKNIKRKLFN